MAQANSNTRLILVAALSAISFAAAFLAPWYVSAVTLTFLAYLVFTD